MTGWVPQHTAAVELVVRAPARDVAEALLAPGATAWRAGLRLHRYDDRGDEGARFVVTGLLVGTCEWWIEALPPGPGPEGVVVHFWLRGRATRDGRRTPARSVPGPAGWMARRRTELLVRTRAQRFRHLVMRLRRELTVSP